MRIGTWNLERLKGNPAKAHHYDEVLNTLRADLVVATEPGPQIHARFPNAVCSASERPAKKGRESWIALLGGERRLHGIDYPYERLATSAWTEIGGQRIALYGSVLPWNAARSQAPEVYGDEVRPFTDVFDHALSSQVADIMALQLEFGRRNVFWAGDFNHPLVGPLHGYSKHARQGIAEALDELGMRAFNRESPGARPGTHSIDLICGSIELTVSIPVSQFPEVNGRALSDHGAHYVDISWP
jgi:hypothetical protein